MEPGPGGMNHKKETRTDRKGNPISKKKDCLQTKDKKVTHQIMFADQLPENESGKSEEKLELAIVIYVESYKSFNKITNEPNS
jgi:hypothetical protein